MQTPLINGNYYDFSSIQAYIATPAGPYFTLGIKSINYDDGLKPGDVRGTHPQRIGRTKGTYESNGDFEIYRPQWQELINALGAGFKQIEFDIQVHYAEPVLPTVTDILRSCRIVKSSNGASQGTDQILIKVELDVFEVKWGGLSSLTNPLT